MAAASRLGRQLEEVIASLSKVDARFALIGGLALASHKVIRATQDIDLLTDSEKAEDIDRQLVAIGYQCLHRSPDAGNYLRGDERVNFICASRPAARGLLSNAATIPQGGGAQRRSNLSGRADSLGPRTIERIPTPNEVRLFWLEHPCYLQA